MAITSNDPRNGVPQITDKHTETNSQSFKAGELVYFDASGGVLVAAAGTTPVAGVAMKDATNVTSGNIAIPVQLIRPDDEVLIQVEDGSGNLEAANTTCLPGIAYDIVVSSNHHRLNSSDTTGGIFIFVEEILDANGDATYWARCRPLYSENQISAQ